MKVSVDISRTYPSVAVAFGFFEMTIPGFTNAPARCAKNGQASHAAIVRQQAASKIFLNTIDPQVSEIAELFYKRWEAAFYSQAATLVQELESEL